MVHVLGFKGHWVAVTAIQVGCGSTRIAETVHNEWAAFDSNFIFRNRQIT